MTPFETVETTETVTACAGGPLGHPKVYLSLLPSGRVECPYCSRLFINPSVARSAGAPPAKGEAAHG